MKSFGYMITTASIFLAGASFADPVGVEFNDAPVYVQDQIRALGIDPERIAGEAVYVFEADVTGNGHSDALAIYYYFEQNRVLTDSALFRGDGSGMSFVGEVQMFGGNPRDFSVEDGSIFLTTTVSQPGDQRCCPTGVRNYQIEMPGS